MLVQPRLRLAALLALVAACTTPSRAPRLAYPPLVAHAPRASSIDVEHYALDIALDPAARSMRGTCTVRFQPRGTAVSEVELELEGLAVESVADSDGRALAFEHSGRMLRIALGAPLAPHDSAQVAIRYAGAPRKGLWFSAERDGVPTQAFTQGECEDSHWWFPCVDDPAERATSELRVALPPGWSSLAAGELVESSGLAGGGRSELWRMHVPHAAYLTTLAAGEFTLVRDTWEGVPLEYAARPALGAWLDATFEPTGEVLAFLGELTGVRYPYVKYAQVCVDNFPFGGMENISATTLTDTCVRDELGRRDGDARGLIAHEAAHQWFGDLLTCADWSHIWLNESFATYCGALYTEATRGTDEFLVAVRDLQEGYLAADVGARRRPHVWNVYREPMDLFFGGQAYAGGACRLHLLRFVLGDDAFFRGLRRYVADNAGRAVVTDDFQRALELESGLELGPFFAQWITPGAGYPEFEVRWTWHERKGVVRVEVEQVQTPMNGTPSVFVVPVDIEVRDGSGARVTRVTLDNRRETFELAAPRRPTWVVFDKQGRIPKRCVSVRALDEWLALAAEDDDPNGRRDALAALGAALAQSSDDTLRWKIAGVMLARLDDSCVAVRAAAARSFARVYTPVDHPISAALMSAACSDPEVVVRIAALETLAAWKHNAGFAKFGHEQFEARFSPGTMGAAAALVVAAEGPSALAWITRELGSAARDDALRAGLLNALARLPGDDASAVLLECALDERAGAGSREVAVRCLGRRKPAGAVRRAFVALLASTREYRLQGALIDALGTFGDAQSRRALEQHHAACVDSRQRRAIEAALAKLDP